MLEGLLQDARYGFGQLRRNPGFTSVTVLMLALGIGANTALFSVIEGVVLAPLPYAQPGRLVLILDDNLALKHDVSVSYSDFRDWQSGAKSFKQMAAIMFRGFDLTSPGAAEHVEGRHISAGFFHTLGVKLALGREFSPEEDRHGGAPGIVLSHRQWRERFAGSAGALGKLVTLSGVSYRIVGVAPAAFRFFDDADVYVPLGQGDPLTLDDRSVHPGLFCVARLKDGVSIAQAQAEMSAIESHLDELYPLANRGLGASVMVLKQEMIGDVRGTLLMLWGAVGLVLLIACANVASLLLARAAARAREFAIRSALGASGARIVRQLVTESVLVSLAGGALGLVVAKLALRTLLDSAPVPLPRSENIALNPAVLGFTFLVTIVVGVLFGLAPAIQGARADPQASLNDGGRGSTGTHRRAQASLVVGQMALTMMLLTGAGLLFRTIHNLWEVNPGFDPRQVITFKVGLSPALTRRGAEIRSAYRALIERIGQIPGVEAADLSTLVSFNQQDNSGPFRVGTNAPASMSEAPRALYHETGPDYLRVMKIPLLEGRFLDADDTMNSEKVVVIDSVLAHAYFPDRNPLGERIWVAHWGVGRIVGVVGHARHWGLGRPGRFTRNQVYISFYQLPDEWLPLFNGDMTVVVRTRGESMPLVPAIRAAVRTAGSDQTLYGVETMRGLVASALAPQQFPLLLFETFSSLALALAAAGVYGVISYSVAQRASEIGIRMALGAGRHEVFRMVIGEGLRLVVTGLAIGTAAGLALTRGLCSFSNLLYGVEAADPLTFASVAMGLITVAALACYAPARRAARVDPIEALRHG